MITETYKGRTIKVRKGRKWGTFHVSVNGVQVACSRTGTDQDKPLADVKNMIDFIDRDPVVDGSRWAACWYPPGAYQICPEGHPVAPGGTCRHPYCTPATREG
jgi:hypothetical protein